MAKRKKRSPFFRYVVSEAWGNVPVRIGQVLVELQDRGDSFKELHCPVVLEDIESRGRIFKVPMKGNCTGGYVAVRVRKERTANGD